MLKNIFAVKNLNKYDTLKTDSFFSKKYTGIPENPFLLTPKILEKVDAIKRESCGSNLKIIKNIFECFKRDGQYGIKYVASDNKEPANTAIKVFETKKANCVEYGVFLTPIFRYAFKDDEIFAFGLNVKQERYSQEIRHVCVGLLLNEKEYLPPRYAYWRFEKDLTYRLDVLSKFGKIQNQSWKMMVIDAAVPELHAQYWQAEYLLDADLAAIFYINTELRYAYLNLNQESGDSRKYACDLSKNYREWVESREKPFGGGNIRIHDVEGIAHVNNLPPFVESRDFVSAGHEAVIGGDYKTAEMLFKKAITMNRHSFHAYMGLFRLKFKTGEIDEALEYGKETINVLRTLLFVRKMMNRFLSENSDNSTMMHFEGKNTQNINEQMVFALVEVGFVFLASSRVDEALSVFKRACGMSNNNQHFRNLLGLAYIAKHDELKTKGDDETAGKMLSTANEYLVGSFENNELARLGFFFINNRINVGTKNKTFDDFAIDIHEALEKQVSGDILCDRDLCCAIRDHFFGEMTQLPIYENDFGRIYI